MRKKPGQLKKLTVNEKQKNAGGKMLELDNCKIYKRTKIEQP